MHLNPSWSLYWRRSLISIDHSGKCCPNHLSYSFIRGTTHIYVYIYDWCCLVTLDSVNPLFIYNIHIYMQKVSIWNYCRIPPSLIKIPQKSVEFLESPQTLYPWNFLEFWFGSEEYHEIFICILMIFKKFRDGGIFNVGLT